MIRKRDIYDEEVDRLTANPDNIYSSWSQAKPLFYFCTINISNTGNRTCGCLSMIKQSTRYYKVDIHPDINDELTKQIQADKNLPDSIDDIKPKHLKYFAKWQRKLDKYRKKYSNIQN